MQAVVGVFMIVLALLSFVVVMLASRKPSPPAWSRHRLTHEIAVVGSLSLVCFGIGLEIRSSEVAQQSLTAIQWISIGAILVVFAVVWLQLKVRATLAEYDRQREDANRAAKSQPTPATGSATIDPEDPSSPTRPRSPTLSKKAA